MARDLEGQDEKSSLESLNSKCGETNLLSKTIRVAGSSHLSECSKLGGK